MEDRFYAPRLSVKASVCEEERRSPAVVGISAARPTSCLTPEKLQILEMAEKEEEQEVKEDYEKYQKKLRLWEKKWTTTVISTKSIEIGKSVTLRGEI